MDVCFRDRLVRGMENETHHLRFELLESGNGRLRISLHAHEQGFGGALGAHNAPHYIIRSRSRAKPGRLLEGPVIEFPMSCRKIPRSLLQSRPMELEHIVAAFEASADVKCAFIRQHAELAVEVGQLLIRTFREGRKVLLFGNGGSATDASHIAAEFVGRYKRDRDPLPALALATDMAALTCIANDYDYTDIFSRQILAHGRKGDVAVAISTSGNSLNVIRGVEAARERGLSTVGWTGETGGKLGEMVEYCFRVPSGVTARIQECHITLGHVLCEFVEERLFCEHA